MHADGTRGKAKSSQYPEGYLRPKGTGRITSEENADVRLESSLRLINSGGVSPVKRRRRPRS